MISPLSSRTLRAMLFEHPCATRVMPTKAGHDKGIETAARIAGAALNWQGLLS